MRDYIFHFLHFFLSHLIFLFPRSVSPFSQGMNFTRARVSLALLSLRENGDYSLSTYKASNFKETFTSELGLDKGCFERPKRSQL